jgi:signal transduction histidine kinase
LYGNTSLEELKTKTAFDFGSAYTPDTWKQYWEELKQKKSLHYIVKRTKKDGTTIDLEINANMIQFGDLELNCIYVNDITEKKKAEAEIYAINELLKSQTNRLLLATKSAKIGIWDRDLENDSTIWDEGMYKLYGIAPNEFKTINEGWTARLHDEDRTKIFDEMQFNIANKNEFNSEFRIVWNDESIHYIKTSGFIQRVDGKPKRIIGVSWDVTKDKEMELEKETLLKELVANNLELKQFSYITSHNLRAPLTNLVSICDIIQPAIGTDDITLQLIDAFKTSTYHLNETLNDLIEVLIIKENRNITKEQLTFEEIFKKTKESISISLLENKVTINEDFSEAPSVIFANEYLQSVFLNLLTNAVKYRHPDRALIITIKTSKENNGNTKLTFSDNGIGINMAHAKDKIFGLYKRFHNNANSKGIGLYLIHSQITTLGGKIDVESEVNIGTTFTIIFK